MKLYYAPGACSLADHIALREAGLEFELVRVDIRAKKTADGEDFLAVNPKGYVPALALDEGGVLTENIAMLAWLAEQGAGSTPPGPLGRTHLVEALAYISTEVHKGFKPYFTPGASDEAKAAAGAAIAKRLEWLAENFAGDYLFGAEPSAADFYLFVMLLWAGRQNVAVPDPLPAFRDRMMQRPAVQAAMRAEGLI
jgi:glutathione S-transferase